MKERKRSGVSVVRLLRSCASVPDYLTRNRVSNILTGKVVDISESECEFLLWAFSRFPTMERIKLTSKNLSRISRLMEEKGVTATQISKAMPGT